MRNASNNSRIKGLIYNKTAPFKKFIFLKKILFVRLNIAANLKMYKFVIQ